VFQKLHHLSTANRSGKQAKVKITPRHSSHRAQMLPVKVVLQNRCLPPGRPSPTTMGLFTQPALVHKDYRSTLVLRFFLSLGQRLFFHRSIFSSSRSNALRAGLWQLQPISCKIRHTWAGWCFTPHSSSIRSATREVVHSAVSYPRACAPCLSFLSTRCRSAGLSKGFRPARPAFLSPFIPDAPSSFAHRLTDWRCTPTRRATSAWLAPCRNSRAASSRRLSSASKSRRTPIGFPMHSTLTRNRSYVTIICKDQNNTFSFSCAFSFLRPSPMSGTPRDSRYDYEKRSRYL
jgi:hypothetical protein